MPKELTFRVQLDETESGLTSVKTIVEVDGQQLGLLTHFRVEASSGTPFPFIEISILDNPGFDWGQLSDRAMESVRTSVRLLQQFFFVRVRTSAPGLGHEPPRVLGDPALVRILRDD